MILQSPGLREVLHGHNGLTIRCQRLLYGFRVFLLLIVIPCGSHGLRNGNRDRLKLVLGLGRDHRDPCSRGKGLSVTVPSRRRRPQSRQPPARGAVLVTCPAVQST